jgi:predicted Zn-dependent protease
MRRVLMATAIGAALLLTTTAGSAATERRLVLVPLGTFPGATANAEAVRLRRELGIRVTVAPRLTIPTSARDAARDQLVAERLNTLVANARARDARDEGTALLGLTTQDIYPGQSGFRWAFSNRSGDRLGVLSTARMDAHNYGLRANEWLLRRRLHKIALRNAAIVTLGRTVNRNTRSVLFSDLLSVDGLDAMEPRLAPRPYSAAKRRWLAGAATICDAYRREASQLPPLNTQPGFLAGLTKAIPIEVRATAKLRRLHAAPGDAELVRRLLADLNRQAAGDRAALADLKRSWSAARLQRWQIDNLSLNATARALALELGSRGCAALFRAA